MAVFTPLTRTQAQRVLAAHGLGTLVRITPVPAGSVNSNFVVDSTSGRHFLRIYEEQGPEGVRYEWALLDHLAARGVPVPRRIAGPAPGALEVDDKPVALFGIVGGTESCQAGVTRARAAAIGGALARAHRAGATFDWPRASRFSADAIAARLQTVDGVAHPELEPTLRRLESAHPIAHRALGEDLPRGVIHGDLFRDNVRWEGERVVAVLDWESASDGPFAYDLMVAVLAWCYGSELDWGLARELVAGYAAERPLTAAERIALQPLGIAAALRFTVTRITDYHLREAVGERVLKDYRRFLARLEVLRALSPDEVAGRLTG